MTSRLRSAETLLVRMTAPVRAWVNGVAPRRWQPPAPSGVAQAFHDLRQEATARMQWDPRLPDEVEAGVQWEPPTEDGWQRTPFPDDLHGLLARCGDGPAAPPATVVELLRNAGPPLPRTTNDTAAEHGRDMH